MKAFILIFLAHLVLSAPLPPEKADKQDHEHHDSHHHNHELMAKSEGPNEVEVGDVETNDYWCYSNKNCDEGSVCADSKCVLEGKAKLEDLENCVEIEVYGFDEYSIKDGANSRFMNGVYTLLDKKSSTGGKAFKKLPTKYVETMVGNTYYKKDKTSKPIYMYWNSNSQWYFDFDLDAKSIIAHSSQLADDTTNTKRFSYYVGSWHKNVPVSITCKKHDEPSEHSDNTCKDIYKEWKEASTSMRDHCVTYYDSNSASDCACDCKNNKYVKDCVAYDIGYDNEIRKCCFMDRKSFTWEKTNYSSDKYHPGFNLYTLPELDALDTTTEAPEEKKEEKTCTPGCNACGYNWYEKNWNNGNPNSYFKNKSCGCCGHSDAAGFENCAEACSGYKRTEDTQEIQLAAENQRLRAANKALKKALNQVAA